jgi:hypothetical protein
MQLGMATPGTDIDAATRDVENLIATNNTALAGFELCPLS